MLPRRTSSAARALRRDQRGLTLLFWAFSFLGIFAFLAIVADSGLIFVERRQLQNTADAAALAGAQQLFFDEALAVATTEDYALANTADLLTNAATVLGGVEVRSRVSREAGSFFPASSGLSLGAPEVAASATARLAATRLPGRGVFCVAVELGEHTSAESAQAIVDVLLLDWAGLPPYLTTLRLSGGASNAGYIDITGPVNENVRDCLEQGSQNPLKPIEETQTGVAVGQAAQALQNRLEAARARTDNAGGGCFSWAEIVTSIVNADGDRDGIADDGSWVCNPLTNQATSVVLMPVVNEDFTDTPGTIPVHVHDLGTPRPYLMALFFLDAERTFENTAAAKWKFAALGEGLGEIYGVFLTDAPAVLGGSPGAGRGAVVACDPAEFRDCFVQLVD